MSKILVWVYDPSHPQGGYWEERQEDDRGAQPPAPKEPPVKIPDEPKNPKNN